MPRIRSVKPECFRNEQLADLPYEDRLLFIGLWTQADRDGRLEDRPKRLKGELFPYDDLNVDESLGRLANAGLILRYEGNGLRLIAIPTWAKHQRPHHTEMLSIFPPPIGVTATAPLEHGDAPTGREGKGMDQERKESTALRASFERLWEAFPRKVGKDAAFAEFSRIRPADDVLNSMVAAVIAQSQSPQWLKDGGQFVPHPRTWLKQGRWKDSVDLLQAVKVSVVTRDPLYPQFEVWQKQHGDDGANITFEQFKAFAQRDRA